MTNEKPKRYKRRIKTTLDAAHVGAAKQGAPPHEVGKVQSAANRETFRSLDRDEQARARRHRDDLIDGVDKLGHGGAYELLAAIGTLIADMTDPEPDPEETIAELDLLVQREIGRKNMRANGS